MDILQCCQTQGRSWVIGSGDSGCALTSRGTQGRKQLHVAFFSKLTRISSHKSWTKRIQRGRKKHKNSHQAAVSAHIMSHSNAPQCSSQLLCTSLNKPLCLFINFFYCRYYIKPEVPRRYTWIQLKPRRLFLPQSLCCYSMQLQHYFVFSQQMGPNVTGEPGEKEKRQARNLKDERRKSLEARETEERTAESPGENRARKARKELSFVYNALQLLLAGSFSCLRYNFACTGE